jgi:hypothetical protein
VEAIKIDDNQLFVLPEISTVLITCTPKVSCARQRLTNTVSPQLVNLKYIHPTFQYNFDYKFCFRKMLIINKPYLKPLYIQTRTGAKYPVYFHLWVTYLESNSEPTGTP